MQLSAGTAIILTISGALVDPYKAEREKDKGITDDIAAEGEEKPSVLVSILPPLIIIGIFNLMPLVFICCMKRNRDHLHED